MTRTPLLALPLLCIACGPVDEPTAPEEEAVVVELPNCALDDDIRICIARDDYDRRDAVHYTITNVGDERAYEDRCTGAVEGRYTEDDEWSSSYGSTRYCTNWPDEWDVREAMELLDPGVPVAGTFGISEYAYTGQWRVAIRVFDRNAEPKRDAPFSSPVFQVTND